MGRMWYGNASSDDLHAFRIWSAATADDLLARAGKEMQAGAKSCSGASSNALLLREQEAAFIERGAELAAKHHAFLAFAVLPGYSPFWPYQHQLVSQDKISCHSIRRLPEPGKA